MKWATDNISTVLTKNLWNPRDYAPLKQVERLSPIRDTAGPHGKTKRAGGGGGGKKKGI